MELPRSNLPGGAVPRNDGFCARATRGGTDFDHAAECRIGVIVRVDGAGDSLACFGDQLPQFKRHGLTCAWAADGFESKSTHRAVAHVSQTVQHRDIASRDATVRHIFVDECVAEVVR